jgi:hypothetical protein
MYLLPEVNMGVRPKLLKELKPGTRVVSHEFHMGDWRPEQIEVVRDPDDVERCLYLWIIPASVEGYWTWKLPIFGEEESFFLEIEQHFQDINGEARNQGMYWRIFNAGVQGDQMKFSMISEADDCIIRHDYQGRVKGNTIIGTVRLSGAIDEQRLSWKATRAYR